MIQRLRQWLTLLLVCLLPFHALLVTVLTKAVAGPGHAPLTVIALWKEALLAVIVLLAFFEIFLREFRSQDQETLWSLDLLDGLLIVAVVFACVISFDPVTVAKGGGLGGLLHSTFTLADKRFLLGLKYDFLPLIALFFLRRVPWSDAFLRRALFLLIIIGTIIALYGIATFFLPDSFFVMLGYSDVHSLYFPHASLAAFQQIEASNVRRIQSVLSGPNQLGLWLLLPFAALLWRGGRAVRGTAERVSARSRVLWFLSLLILLSALTLTFSRTAWIAAISIVLVVTLHVLLPAAGTPKRRRTLIVLTGCTAAMVIVCGVAFSRLAPTIFIRNASLAGHLEKPLQAIELMRQHPLGMGLGTAGPASNALSDTCVFLPQGSDYNWARSIPDLCVFVGGTRRHPAGRSCDCPVLTENWYLQFGVELGVFGLAFSLALAFLVLLRFFKVPFSDPKMSVLLAFLGLSVAGLFLHSFEDSAVAYSIWVLLAACIVHPHLSRKA